RWARLSLPNGQIARCAWKEIENNLSRISRNVKFQLDGFTYFAEVQYFFRVKIGEESDSDSDSDSNSEDSGWYNLAMVSVYSDAIQNHLDDSFGTLRVVEYEGKGLLEVIDAKSICAVVAMVPFIL
ncbi:hypothetical protein M378DRAFT_45323, partial [Amanita muscaria Koide BX008]